MDSSGERASGAGDGETLEQKIDRLIDSIDANTKAMRDLRIALLDQDEHADEDGKISTYLDGSPK